VLIPRSLLYNERLAETVGGEKFADRGKLLAMEFLDYPKTCFFMLTTNPIFL